jgi:hypothetical protein
MELEQLTQRDKGMEKVRRPTEMYKLQHFFVVVERH